MVKVAIGQMCSTADPLHNLAQATTLFHKAVDIGAKTLLLPEAADYISSSPAESLSLCTPLASSPFLNGILSLSAKHNISCNVGVHEPITSGPNVGKKVFNTSLWIEKGEVVRKYRKMHLFDVDSREGGEVKLTESMGTEAGIEIGEVFESGWGRVGMLVCFDLRFPEPSLNLLRQGAQVLLYPSAFTVPTGLAHWSILLRARAIETQCYVLASAQVGSHNAKRQSYGHSICIDPWGRIIGEMDGEEVGVLGVDIDVEGGVLESVRRGMKLTRRTDVYPEI